MARLDECHLKAIFVATSCHLSGEPFQKFFFGDQQTSWFPCSSGATCPLAEAEDTVTETHTCGGYWVARWSSLQVLFIHAAHHIPASIALSCSSNSSSTVYTAASYLSFQVLNCTNNIIQKSLEQNMEASFISHAALARVATVKFGVHSFSPFSIYTHQYIQIPCIILQVLY